MRLLLFSIVVLLIISSISAAPGKSKSCAKICTLDYTPVCAGPAGSTDNKQKKTFGNLCVMQNYNCEHNEQLVKLSAGECPGSTSVRLQ